MLTAIVAILLGNLLVGTIFAPALQALREILRKFADITLPYDSPWQDERIGPDERRSREKEAIGTFNRLFREYSMSFNTFKKVGGVFFTTIFILAFAVIWQVSLSTELRILLSILIPA